MTSGYVVANGIRIFYVEEGDGPLVLMCHGFPESHFSWRYQMEPVATAGFRAVAIDLPGYGLSDKPDVTYDVEWLNACLSGVITGLGHERAVMVGHDWGGLLVWPFARMYREETAAVIGLNTPDLPRTPLPTTEFIKQSGSGRMNYILDFQERGKAESSIEADIDGFVELMFRGPVTVKKEAFPDEVMRVYADLLRPRGAITPPLEYYRNMDRNWELVARFDDDKVEVPCLMIAAEGDPVLRPELTENMEARVPDLEKVVIEDCGHWTQQEQPERVNDSIVSFLGRR